jgi:hypothetical protein
MRANITAAVLAAVALTACGSTPTPPPSASGSRLPINYDRPVQQVQSPDCVAWVGPPSLDYLRNTAHYRAVAIMTIDQKVDTRWNSPDGQRLTQAQVVAEEASPNRYQPFLMTGWAMHPSRVLRGTVPGSIVAYTVGGTLGSDTTTEAGTGCLITAPQPGHTYLVAFGAEVNRQATASLVRPVIAELLPYNPATGVVVTRGGIMYVPAAGL